MKKIALLGLVVILFALMSGVAYGVLGETPHGPFNEDTAMCAACHRAHVASAEYLLATPKVTSLCITCHSNGEGADTDVYTGMYVSEGTDEPYLPGHAGFDHADWGTDDGVLMGGGFNRVGGPVGNGGTAVTSKHMSVETLTLNETTWDIKFGHGTAAGEVVYYLDCVDCHGPHRSTNYRMLRAKPTGAVNANYPVKDNFDRDLDNRITESHAYTEDVGQFNIKYGTGGNASSISSWCGGCHDYYYRSAIRADNKSGNMDGVTSGPQTKLTANAAIGANSIQVAEMASMSTAPPSVIHIGAEEFNVGGLSGGGTGPGTVTFTVGQTLAADYYIGEAVTIEGAGMEVYFDLNNDGTADQNYMHAVDVNLQYIPRNGSIAAPGLNLATYLAAGAADDPARRMPVYDQDNDGVYDSTDLMNCLTCHRAHGSEVAMEEDAELEQPSRRVETPNEQLPWGSDSMLLRLKNRAVCNTCHNMPQGF